MNGLLELTGSFDRLFVTDAKTRRDIPLNLIVKLEDYVTQYYGRAKVLNVQGVKIYFSYETPIAVEMPGSLPIVTDEHFSATTGRHKNRIKPQDHRRAGEYRFRQLLRDAFAEMAERVSQTKRVT